MDDGDGMLGSSQDESGLTNSTTQVTGDLWERYLQLIADPRKTDGDAMDELGLKRYCCRRMIMTHVDLIEKLLKYVGRRPGYPSWTRTTFMRGRQVLTIQVHARRPQRKEAGAQRDVEASRPIHTLCFLDCFIRRRFCFASLRRRIGLYKIKSYTHKNVPQGKKNFSRVVMRCPFHGQCRSRTRWTWPHTHVPFMPLVAVVAVLQENFTAAELFADAEP